MISPVSVPEDPHPRMATLEVHDGPAGSST
jgi:hypothetical protein